jgi:hypothetical protein
VNHLAGFHLTNLLRERLEASRATVVNTSSAANNMAAIDWGDLQNERGYGAMTAYARAKLMNILHAREIARRFDGVAAASFHPGGVATGFGREGSWLMRLVFQGPLRRFYLITPEQGADTLVWLLSGSEGSDWQSGEYYAKRKAARRNAQASPETARRLWEASEALLAGGGTGS